MKKVLLLLLAIGILACNTPRKLIVSGDYDFAIEKLVKKLRRNSNNDDRVLLLERAYLGAQQADLNRIDFLKNEGNENNWVEISTKYQNIKYRQELIRPLLPLKIIRLKRDANIKFIDIDNQIINSRQKASDYYFNVGLQKLHAGGRGNARAAYSNFQKVKSYNYLSRYSNIDSLTSEAHFNGEVFVLFKMRNASDAILPKDFESELLKISVQDLNSEWINFHLNQQEGIKYNFHVVANIKNIEIGPEQWKEKEFEETKQVPDGWQYVLDKKGNVKKDSLGNDIKIPKTKTIKCRIKEIQQTKVASIQAVVDYMSLESNQLLGSFPVKADAVFQNYSAKAFGNTEALIEETKRKLGNQPLPFPTNFQLISQAGETMKPLIKQVLAEHQNLVQY